MLKSAIGAYNQQQVLLHKYLLEVKKKKKNVIKSYLRVVGKVVKVTLVLYGSPLDKIDFVGFEVNLIFKTNLNHN